MRSPAKRAPASKPKAPPASSKTPAKKEAKKTLDAKLESVVENANKHLGTKAVILAAGGEDVLWSKPRHYISTQSLALDAIIGKPGLPSGRFSEIYGPNGVGKTTLLDHLVSETQKQGGVAVLIDTEHVRDLAYMKILGIDTSRVIFNQLSTIEDVFAAVTHYAVELRKALGDDCPILIAWDSIAGTPTIAEMEAKMGDKFRAEAAKVIRQSFRRACQTVAQTQVCFVATNQVYSKMQTGGWGDGQDTYGGDGPKYHATVRLDLFPLGRVYPRGTSKEDRGIPPVGQIVSCRVVKNKVAAPHRSRRFAIAYGHGIDNGWSIWHDFAGDHRVPCEVPAIIDRGSGWYSLADDLGDFKSWQGAHHGLADLVRENPELWGKLVEKYKELP